MVAPHTRRPVVTFGCRRENPAIPTIGVHLSSNETEDAFEIAKNMICLRLRLLEPGRAREAQPRR